MNDTLSHEPVYMISVAAKLCDVHEQTLRLYERVGLLHPERVRGKNRLYSQADIERVRQIQTLTQVMGVNLAGVEVILRMKEQMRRMRRDVEHELARLHQETVAEFERVVKQFSVPVEYRVPLPAELPTHWEENDDAGSADVTDREPNEKTDDRRGRPPNERAL